MKYILCATDLSFRADLAIDRAATLARQFGARLRLLRVVDEDQPREIVEPEVARARQALDLRIQQLNRSGPLEAECDVKPGVVFQTIVSTVQAWGADVVVVGAHRRRILKDVVVGTTIERVMRTGTHPVLMVNAATNAPYESVLLALDASKASALAANAAKSLRILEDVRVSVVRAFEPVYKGMLEWAGALENTVTEYSESWAREARVEIGNLLREAGLRGEVSEILVEEGPPFLVVKRAIERLEPQLLVIGTHGRTGLRRALLGSVAEQVIREAGCDVLVVPAGRAA